MGLYNISNTRIETSHGRREVAEISSIHHNKTNMPQLTALKVNAVNIPTRRETLTIGAL
jgi:hypothetical protein